MSKEAWKIPSCPFKAPLDGWLFLSLDLCWEQEPVQQGLISLEMPGLVLCSLSDFGWLQLSPSLNVGRVPMEGE